MLSILISINIVMAFMIRFEAMQQLFLMRIIMLLMH